MVYLFYFSFFTPGASVEAMLGVIDDPTNPMDIDYKAFLLIYISLLIVAVIITGIHFSIMSMKVREDRSMFWKDRFLFVAFATFGFSAIFDEIVEMEAIILIIVRILLVASIFLLYVRLNLPNWMSKILNIPISTENVK